MSNASDSATAPSRAGSTASADRSGDLTLVMLFTATTFLSALLLFSIQPLFTKRVLPLLGGAPSVWAVALCFFQGALLAGYCYAHALNRYVPVAWAGLVHLGLFALAMLSLPIGVPAAWSEPPPGDPAIWQIGLFSVAVGVPFLAVAANAPLLQAWFARTGHPQGADPYFLYAASNLGSFAALLAYPLLLEPQFGLTALSRQWTLGFVMLGFAIAVCFVVMRRTAGLSAATSPATARATAPTDTAPTWMRRLGWVGLAMVPSALLTAYTTHIATDVASAPLIWVGPLALYLLTFVIVFRDRPLAFVPCAMAAAAAGWIVAPWLAGISLASRASGLAAAVAIVACASLGWAVRRGTLAGIASRVGLGRLTERSSGSTPLQALLVALLAVLLFRLVRQIATASGLAGGDPLLEMGSTTHRTVAGIGALLAVLAFSWAWLRSSVTPTRWILGFHLAAVVLALMQMSQTRIDDWFASASVGVFAFFFSGLVAHRTLYEARPAASRLTEFYLWMSLGGVLGGLFAALVAPRIFNEVLEHPILLALTMACRPGALRIDFRDREELLRLWLIAALGVLAVWWTKLFDLDDRIWDLAYWIGDAIPVLGVGEALSEMLRGIYHYGTTALLALIFAVVVVLSLRQPARQLAAALVMCLAIVALPSSVKRSFGQSNTAERSYFGVYRISQSHDHQFQTLTHGTTLHGAQRIADNTGALVVDTTPGTYYHPGSPMAKTVELVRERLQSRGQKGRYGVVGLGTGSLACHSKEGEPWRFFEIDPVIVGIASDPVKFSFVHNCQPKLDVVLGDARLTMSKDPDKSFDLIIVDAFSSDAIPVHLLTAEAVSLYAAKLKPEGVLLLHISNRYLDLDSVVAATARLVPGLEGLLLVDDEADGSYSSTQSTAAVLSGSSEALEPFRKLDMAKDLAPTDMRGWTDDYSDVLAPFMSRYRSRG